MHASCCWKSPQETWFPIHLIHHQASLFPTREAHRERDNRCWPSWSVSKRALLGEFISNRKSHSTVSYTGTLRKCQPYSQHAQTHSQRSPGSLVSTHWAVLRTTAVKLDKVAEAAGSLPGPLNWILNCPNPSPQRFYIYFDPLKSAL